jgi:hypothetical protein
MWFKLNINAGSSIFFALISKPKSPSLVANKEAGLKAKPRGLSQECRAVAVILDGLINQCLVKIIHHYRFHEPAKS